MISMVSYNWMQCYNLSHLKLSKHGNGKLFPDKIIWSMFSALIDLLCCEVSFREIYWTNHRQSVIMSEVYMRKRYYCRILSWNNIMRGWKRYPTKLFCDLAQFDGFLVSLSTVILEDCKIGSWRRFGKNHTLSVKNYWMNTLIIPVIVILIRELLKKDYIND